MKKTSTVLAVLLAVPLTFWAADRPSGKDGSAPKETRRYQVQHSICLKNGRTILGTVTARNDHHLTVRFGSFGTMLIPRNQVDQIKEKPAVVALSSRALTATTKPSCPPATRQKAGPQTGKAAKADRFTLPPIPEDQVQQLKRWLYELSRTDSHNRIRAERHLKAMGNIVVGPVIPFTRKPQWLIRCAALRILAEVNHPAGVTAIFTALQDSHPVVRQVADESLRKVTGCDSPSKPYRDTKGAHKKFADRWAAILKKKQLLP